MSIKTIYHFTNLTGGTATALDSVDGNSLLDKDRAFVLYNSVAYIYELDDDSGAAENSPHVIAPDTNPGNKRWILQDDTSNILETLTNANVAHGMTSIAATNVFGQFTIINSTQGGLDVYGLTDADQDGALRLTGIIGSIDPTDTYSALILRGGKKSGTTWQALGAAE